MKTLEERLDEQLEQTRTRVVSDWQHLSGFTRFEPREERDLEVENLLILASSLKSARQIQVSPVFARQVERRLMRRSAELRLRKGAAKRVSFSLFRAHPVFTSILGLCLLLLVFSASTLAYASQIVNPANPLYGLKRLEQHFQVSLANNPGKQASLDLQFARARLNALSDLAHQTHSADYIQALADFQQQVQTTTLAVNSLPMGAQHQQLADQLAGFHSDAVRVLRGFLPDLDIPARLVTTDTLAFLGERVPRLSSGVLTIAQRPDQSAMLRLSGTNLPSIETRLLVDGQLLDATGTLQNGQLLFVISNWNGEHHPRSLGILSPDGTAAQTIAITIVTSNENGNSNNENSNNENGNNGNNGTNNGNNGNNGTGNGNSNKPKTTPTPHH